MRTKWQLLILALMPALLLLSAHSAAQSITNPRMRGMSSMQDHHSHPQSRQTVARPAMEEVGEPAFKFVSIDVPDASATLATGINARGAIVGIYYDTAGNEHGFLLKDRNFLTVDVPGSLVGVSGMLQTEANGINAAGDIVGDYFAPPLRTPKLANQQIQLAHIQTGLSIVLPTQFQNTESILVGSEAAILRLVQID